MYLVFGQDLTDDATALAANTTQKLNAEYLSKLYSAKKGFTMSDKSGIIWPALREERQLWMNQNDMNPVFEKRKD